MRKRRLDQCQQYVVFERSAKQVHKTHNSVALKWCSKTLTAFWCFYDVTLNLYFAFVCFQALEWIHDTGEFYLSTHTSTGSSIHHTQELLKEHEEFHITAKVGYMTHIYPHTLKPCDSMYAKILYSSPSANQGARETSDPAGRWLLWEGPQSRQWDQEMGDGCGQTLPRLLPAHGQVPLQPGESLGHLIRLQ